MASESTYAMFWKDGPNRTDMTINDIYGLPFDTASWAAFLGVLMGTRRFATMTMHNEYISVVKLMPADNAEPHMNFNNIA